MASEDRIALVWVAVVSVLSRQQAWSPSQIGGRPLLVFEEQWGEQVRLVSYLRGKRISVKY